MSSSIQMASRDDCVADTASVRAPGDANIEHVQKMLFDMDADAAGVIDYTFVIPVKDEQNTLGELCSRICGHIPANSRFEILFIDDGSTDESWAKIQELHQTYPEIVTGVRLRANFGKATALAAGFAASRGRVLFTMDADLQDDAAEIPNFLNKLNEGYDLVSGWKRVRHDPWHKVLPSRVFNWMLSRASGVKLHDHNCGFKCYRRELAKNLCLHGELHRMTPSLAAMQGFRCAEIEVKHHPRRYGRSKYGIERFFRGFSDMASIGLLRKYRQRPSHLLHGFALAFFALAAFHFICGAMSKTWIASLMLFLTAGITASMSVLVCLLAFCTELLLRQAGMEAPPVPIAEHKSADKRS